MTDERLILNGLRDLVEFHRGNKDSAETIQVEISAADLRGTRQRANLTQEKLAQIYGIPIGTIRNWEQGRREFEGGVKLVPLLIELMGIIKDDSELASKIYQKILERGETSKDES